MWGWASNLSMKTFCSLQKPFKHARGWNYYQKVTEHTTILPIYRVQGKALTGLSYSLGYARKGYDHHVSDVQSTSARTGSARAHVPLWNTATTSVLADKPVSSRDWGQMVWHGSWLRNKTLSTSWRGWLCPNGPPRAGDCRAQSLAWLCRHNLQCWVGISSAGWLRNWD